MPPNRLSRDDFVGICGFHPESVIRIFRELPRIMSELTMLDPFFSSDTKSQHYKQ